MTENIAVVEFKQGMRLLRDAHPNNALSYIFRKAAELEKHNPYFMLFVGVSLRGACRTAMGTCIAALRNSVEPEAQ